MGQHCSCLEHPPKYQRRQSDDIEPMDMERGNNDDGELELQVLDAQETHELLGTRASTLSGGWNIQRELFKWSGSTVTIADTDRREDEEEKKSDELQRQRCLSMGSMELNTNNYSTALVEPKELSRLLRSYQKATGMVDKGQLELECIMCLDTFSNDNPKVRTLCNCGMNRTNFHMSCLLEWLNRDANCPVCREYLFFEDS